MKKETKEISQARFYITATFNNTLVNVTDNQGNTIFWETTGTAGLKGQDQVVMPP